MERIERLSALPQQTPAAIDKVLSKLGQRAARLRAQLREVQEEQARLEKEFTRRGGWSRGFLVVTNGHGHLHKATNCQTCFPTTQFCWLTEESGKTEAEIVERAGERACTVCYPTAPVEARNRPTQLFTPEEIEAKAKRDAQKLVRDEKNAKKAADAITAPDGSKLRVDGDTIVTLKAALSALTNAYIDRRCMSDYTLYAGMAEDQRLRNVERYAADIETLVEAIAHKTGWSQQTIRSEGTARAIKKFKRDWKRAWGC